MFALVRDSDGKEFVVVPCSELFILDKSKQKCVEYKPTTNRMFSLNVWYGRKVGKDMVKCRVYALRDAEHKLIKELCTKLEKFRPKTEIYQANFKHREPFSLYKRTTEKEKAKAKTSSKNKIIPNKGLGSYYANKYQSTSNEKTKNDSPASANKLSLQKADSNTDPDTVNDLAEISLPALANKSISQENDTVPAAAVSLATSPSQIQLSEADLENETVETGDSGPSDFETKTGDGGLSNLESETLKTGDSVPSDFESETIKTGDSGSPTLEAQPALLPSLPSGSRSSGLDSQQKLENAVNTSLLNYCKQLTRENSFECEKLNEAPSNPNVIEDLHENPQAEKTQEERLQHDPQAENLHDDPQEVARALLDGLSNYKKFELLLSNQLIILRKLYTQCSTMSSPSQTNDKIDFGAGKTVDKIWAVNIVKSNESLRFKIHSLAKEIFKVKINNKKEDMLHQFWFHLEESKRGEDAQLFPDIVVERMTSFINEVNNEVANTEYLLKASVLDKADSNYNENLEILRTSIEGGIHYIMQNEVKGFLTKIFSAARAARRKDLKRLGDSGTQESTKKCKTD